MLRDLTFLVTLVAEQRKIRTNNNHIIFQNKACTQEIDHIPSKKSPNKIMIKIAKNYDQISLYKKQITSD